MWPETIALRETLSNGPVGCRLPAGLDDPARAGSSVPDRAALVEIAIQPAGPDLDGDEEEAERGKDRRRRMISVLHRTWLPSPTSQPAAWKLVTATVVVVGDGWHRHQ